MDATAATDPNGVFYLAAATRTRSCTIPCPYDPNGVFYLAAATHATIQTGVIYLAAAQHHLRAPGDRVLALASHKDTNIVGDLLRPGRVRFLSAHFDLNRLARSYL